MQDNAAEPNRSRGRWILLLLFAFFAVPLLAVVAMHKFDWHPQGNSHGELVKPARKLQMPAHLLDVHGLAVKPELWQDRWSMVYIADDCEKACADRLYTMRQLHATLAKDIERVQRVLIAPSGQLQALQKQYPDLLILTGPNEELPDLRKQFDLAGVPAGSNDRIYLVDPLGNLMMSFPDTIAVSDIRKNIQRLLAYAWAG
jgi:cytochrome oxidase Cu insertion factor (SCO1/SenC/PrrC family)